MIQIPEAISQDEVGENESCHNQEESGQLHKEEEQEVNGWVGGVQSPVNSNDWEGEVLMNMKVFLSGMPMIWSLSLLQDKH